VVKTVNQMHERNDAFEGVNAHRALSSQLGASFLPLVLLYGALAQFKNNQRARREDWLFLNWVPSAPGRGQSPQLQGKEKWIL
jgi:hypothetical protein